MLNTTQKRMPIQFSVHESEAGIDEAYFITTTWGMHIAHGGFYMHSKSKTKAQ